MAETVTEDLDVDVRTAQYRPASMAQVSEFFDNIKNISREDLFAEGLLKFNIRSYERSKDLTDSSYTTLYHHDSGATIVLLEFGGENSIHSHLYIRGNDKAIKDASHSLELLSERRLEESQRNVTRHSI